MKLKNLLLALGLLAANSNAASVNPSGQQVTLHFDNIAEESSSAASSYILDSISGSGALINGATASSMNSLSVNFDGTLVWAPHCVRLATVSIRRHIPLEITGYAVMAVQDPPPVAVPASARGSIVGAPPVGSPIYGGAAFHLNKISSCRLLQLANDPPPAGGIVIPN